MKNKVVKITIEGVNSGKYKLYVTSEQLLNILNNNELFTGCMVDAKTGHETIHKEKILYALGYSKTETKNN